MSLNDDSDPLFESIGVATLTKDGHLHVILRATEEPGSDQILGDAFFVMTEDDPSYRTYLDAVGGLRPGQSKPIPPFEDSYGF